MATKVFCDRCGKEITHRRFLTPGGRSKNITIWADGFEIDTDHIFYERLHRELCFECYKDFRDFFNKPTRLQPEEEVDATKQD